MICRICKKPLTGEGAFLGIGPVCRKHRAEAMQLHLQDLKPTTITDEDLETMDPYKDEKAHEVIDYDMLRGKE